MATAEVRKITKTVEVEEPDGVTLHLGEAETRTLWAILMRVGGSPTASPRKHAEAMIQALEAATGRDPYGGPDDHVPESDLIDRARHSIYFRDYPDPAIRAAEELTREMCRLPECYCDGYAHA